MICKPCANAHKFKTEKRQRIAHALCRGLSWCDCQHRTKDRTVKRASGDER